MHRLTYENHDSIPVFKCTLCGSCTGLETENHFGLNRGCCYYFPTSLLFRKCRFVSEKGCAIAFNLRPHPCNLYLCRGVIDRRADATRDYARERKDYFAYCRYMDRLLEDALRSHELTLKADFQKALDLLLAMPVDSFCFSELRPIEFE